MTRMKPWVSIVTCVCFVTCSACSHTVRIPPSSYEKTETTDGTRYRLETTAGDVYETRRLTRDETGFQVQFRKKVGSNIGEREWTEPIHVPFENVKSLESIDPQVGRTVLLALGIVGATTGLLLLAVWHRLGE